MGCRLRHDHSAPLARTFGPLLPPEWVAIYDQESYIELDPRITQTWNRVTPYLWDRHAHQGDIRVASYLDHAAKYGIGSGLVIPLRDALHARILVAFNSAVREFTAARRSEIANALGEIVLLALHFHESFMASFVDLGQLRNHLSAELSAREIQCLQFAAQGLTSADVGYKLCLAE